MLLRRPQLPNRSYHSETVNDADGLLVNAWRSIQLSTGATAEAASNPVAEADLHARHLALVRWRAEHQLEHLMGDPAWHDPVMGGWWIWGLSCWIGSGWCSGRGAWIRGDDDRIERRDAAACLGVGRQRPHLGDDGNGVNHAGTREPGISRQLPHLGDDGKGVNHAGTREPDLEAEEEFHPVTMPEVRRWFGFLSARLRHVRILNGDWHRAVTGGATKTLRVRQGMGPCGIFLDPPYADAAGRDPGLYAEDSLSVAHDVREWAIVAGADPDYRIVLAGFEGEHEGLLGAGWRAVEWFKSGFLKGGMSMQGAGGSQQKRERLWLSPHCLSVEDDPQVAGGSRQGSLFG